MYILQKIFVFCLLLCCSSLYGQTTAPADTLFIFRFESGKGMFYKYYNDNQTELSRMFAFVEQYRKEIHQGQIPFYVDGYSTLLSGEKQNLALASQRSNRVKSELITLKGLTEINFITRNHSRDGSEIVTVRVQIPEPETPKIVIEMRRNEPTVTQEKPAERAIVKKRVPAELESVMPPSADEATRQKQYSLALRTNLLQWATLTPSLGFEWRINQRMGILVDGSWTSWSHNEGARRYALWKVSPEVRYYMGKQRRGFLGAMYHIGEFNYKWGSVGKQGDYQGVGGAEVYLSDSSLFPF